MPQVMMVDNLSKNTQDAIARATFPTKKDTAFHYQFVFISEKLSVWRVFKPSLTAEQCQTIAGIIAKKLSNKDIWWT